MDISFRTRMENLFESSVYDLEVLAQKLNDEKLRTLNMVLMDITIKFENEMFSSDEVQEQS